MAVGDAIRWPGVAAVGLSPPGPVRRAYGDRVPDGYWPSPWPGATLEVVARHDVVAATMPIVREPGELFLLRHTIGADTVACGTCTPPCTSSVSPTRGRWW